MRGINFGRLLGAAMALALLATAASALADSDLRAQMLLGNPDNAVATGLNRNHFLIRRRQYSLSYNDTLHFPNWVSWHLNASDVGNTSRGQFRPDLGLPKRFYQVVPGDYTRSGYDRGHNCPSGDRSDTPENNDAVFVMTNITPQAHGLNGGPWEQLESYCRDLAKQGNELYIVCGHGFSSPTHDTIGPAKIAVPDFAWKVVVVLPNKRGSDLRRMTPRTRVIAVKMPNINTVSGRQWAEYIVTAAEIEKATGLQLFSNIPVATAGAFRTRQDQGIGSIAVPAPERGGTSATPSPPSPGMVWVNTRSGAYWLPGTRFYGRTKKGLYMTERDAQKSGYHAAE